MKKILLFIALSIMGTASIFGALPVAEQRPANPQITCCDHIEICAKASCLGASYAIIPCGAAAAFCCCSQYFKAEQHFLYHEKMQQASVGYQVLAAGACCCGVNILVEVFRSEVKRLQQNKIQARTTMHRE